MRLGEGRVRTPLHASQWSRRFQAGSRFKWQLQYGIQKWNGQVEMLNKMTVALSVPTPAPKNSLESNEMDQLAILVTFHCQTVSCNMARNANHGSRNVSDPRILPHMQYITHSVTSTRDRLDDTQIYEWDFEALFESITNQFRQYTSKCNTATNNVHHWEESWASLIQFSSSQNTFFWSILILPSHELGPPSYMTFPYRNFVSSYYLGPTSSALCIQFSWFYYLKKERFKKHTYFQKYRR
jgi:hypothetical protein